MSRRAQGLTAAILAPITILVALLAWGLSSPPGSSPDEDYHMASIWCAQGVAADRCEQGDGDKSRRLPADVVGAAVCFAFHPDRTATCTFPQDELTPTERGVWADNGYPPLFYATMSIFVSSDLDSSIVVMRTVNAIIYVGVLTALFWLLPIRLRPNMVWAALIGIVPLGMFLVPSVNPSSWAIIQASGLWLAVWGYFEQTGRKKVWLGVMAAVLMILGAGARGDSAAYGILAVLIGTFLALRRERRFALDLILPFALIVVGAAFFLSAGQSSVLTADRTPSSGSFVSLLFTNLQELPQLWVGALGLWGLGWLDTEMPGVVWITVFGLFAGVCFWGLRVTGARKVLSAAAVFSALIVIPLYILVREGIFVGSGVQPRYIYPLLIMLAGIVLIGLRGAALSLGKVQLILIGVGLTCANTSALRANLRRYVTGEGVGGFNLASDPAWWWPTGPSPMVVWVAGSLAFAAATVILLLASYRVDQAVETDTEQSPVKMAV